MANGLILSLKYPAIFAVACYLWDRWRCNGSKWELLEIKAWRRYIELEYEITKLNPGEEESIDSLNVKKLLIKKERPSLCMLFIYDNKCKNIMNMYLTNNYYFSPYYEMLQKIELYDVKALSTEYLKISFPDRARSLFIIKGAEKSSKNLDYAQRPNTFQAIAIGIFWSLSLYTCYSKMQHGTWQYNLLAGSIMLISQNDHIYRPVFSLFFELANSLTIKHFSLNNQLRVAENRYYSKEAAMVVSALVAGITAQKMFLS